MRIVFGSLAVLVSVLAVSMPVMPGHIPGDRLVENLEKQLKQEPNNAQIFYLIGRAHYATYSNTIESSFTKKGEVAVYSGEEKLPHFYSVPGNIYPWNSKTLVRDTPDNRRHILGAIVNLRRALELTEISNAKVTVRADVALARLTLACTFESGALLAPQIPLPAPYDKLKTKEQWRAKAADEYLLSFQRSINNDLKIGHQPIFGLDQLISYEAGKSYLRLQPNSAKAKVVRIKVAELEKIPNSGLVTPVIMDLSEEKSLGDLVSPSSRVSFDLDGTMRNQTYGWVKPTTAFLVWDPLNEGRVSSGRQLFGNATWWMLWDNGYAAMDALDNNRDGWLAGKELAGLALWYDTNVNGKSDRGEVVPIAHTSVSKLRTSFDEFIGSSMVSREGVVLKGGRSLPTYDWVTSPVSK